MNCTIHKSISEIDEKQWEQLVVSSPTASFFQTKEYLLFLKTLSFVEPFVFAVSESGNLKALVCGYITAENGFKRVFSRRAIVLGGLLLSPDVTEYEISFLLDEMAQNLNHKSIYIEIRNNHSYDIYRQAFEKSGFVYQSHYNFKIDTFSEDCLQKVGKSRFRDENTAFGKGVRVMLNPTEKDVKEWYEVLKKLYATRVKKPLFPLEFFEKIRLQNFTRFFLVELDGKIIGGTLCLSWGNKAMYEWFACGLDREEKNAFPSTVSTLASVRYASTEKVSVFDMFGAGVPDEHYGVRDFKNHFGGKLVEDGRFLYICNRLMYKIGVLAIRFLRKFS